MFGSLAWKMYLVLKRMIEYVVAKVMTTTDVDEMFEWIKVYLDVRIEFRDEYRNEKGLGNGPKVKGNVLNIKPKEYFLSLYKYHVEQGGPLPLVETNIAESKNGEMRRFSQKANQTKNVLKTIGDRTARKYAMEMWAENRREEFQGNGSVKSDWTWSKVPQELFQLLFDNGITSATFHCVASATWLGFTFRAKDNMVLLYGNARKMKVGRLQHVFVNKMDNNNLKFVVKPVQHHFIEKLGCFSISETKTADIVIDTSRLISSRPLETYYFEQTNETIFNIYENPVGFIV
jgi:hypothetical protein